MGKISFIGKGNPASAGTLDWPSARTRDFSEVRKAKRPQGRRTGQSGITRFGWPELDTPA
jgi:hypothetical protein